MSADNMRKARLGGLAAALAAEMTMARDNALIPGPALDLYVEGETGHRIGGVPSNANLRSRLMSVRDWVIRMSSQSTSNIALVDATLLTTAHTMTLSGSSAYVTATTLLDLAAFARAVVLYDHLVLVVMPSETSLAQELNTALGSQVILPASIPLETDPRVGLSGVGAFLGNLFESAMSELGKVAEADPGTVLRADLESIARGWGIVLDRQISSRDVLRGRSQENRHWQSDGPGLLNKLIRFDNGADGYSTNDSGLHFPASIKKWFGDQGLMDFVSECNHRSYFNIRLAHAFQVPYVSSVTRIPFRSQLYRNAAFAHDELLLHQEIDSGIDRARYYVPDHLELPLPSFISIAIHNASNTGDIITQIAELREQAAPLRRHRAEYERALHEDVDGKTVQRLRAAVGAEVTRMGRTMVGPTTMAAAAAIAAAASNTTTMTIGLIGVLTALGSLPADQREAIQRRLLRPAEWFLTSTSDTARSIASSGPDASRIWNLTDERVDYMTRRLEALAVLGPA